MKEDKKPTATAVVRKCTCKHEYQDNTYGNSLRVHSVTGIKKNDPYHHCTVCGSTKPGRQ